MNLNCSTAFAGGLLAFIGVTFSPTAQAGVTFFVNNPSGFNTAVTGLTSRGTENWEESTLAPNSGLSINDPLAPGVANGPFTSGSLAGPGITAQSNTLGGSPATTSPYGANGLSTASAGFIGTPSDQLSANQPGNSLDLIVQPATGLVRAVGLNPLYFDFTATTATGKLGTVRVSVYDASNVLLGTQTIDNVGYSEASHIGVLATAGSVIRRVNLYGVTLPSGSVAGADNIAVYVPEPASVCLLGFATLALARRRR